MRFGISRMLGMLTSLFAGAPPPKRSTIMARQNMRRLAAPAEPVKHRYKTGWPNWLKIALNSRR